MDQQSMSVGMLMEAAHSNQKLAESSLVKLAAYVQDLGDALRTEIHGVLVQELQAIVEESRRAAEALRPPRLAARARLGICGAGLMILSVVTPLGVAWWSLPSQSEISALRLRRDELSSEVARLEKRGGRVDLRTCGETKRLCVRVDRKAPAFGEAADYFVVRGY